MSSGLFYYIVSQMERYAAVVYDPKTGIPIFHAIDFLAESAWDLQVWLETYGIPYDDIMRFEEEYGGEDTFDPQNN